MVKVFVLKWHYDVDRMANARAKSEQASNAASIAKQDSDIARLRAKEIDPSFHQPGMNACINNSWTFLC